MKGTKWCKNGDILVHDGSEVNDTYLANNINLEYWFNQKLGNNYPEKMRGTEVCMWTDDVKELNSHLPQQEVNR